jgi:hypothetical protein
MLFGRPWLGNRREIIEQSWSDDGADRPYFFDFDSIK